jgi:Ca2+/Na+ antiporter
MKWEKKTILCIVALLALYYLTYPATRYFIVPAQVRIWPYKVVILYAILVVVIVYLVLRPKLVRRLRGKDQRG